jgi:DtxR family transcriptional regulator, Mn-dependent transcriptional regulator
MPQTTSPAIQDYLKAVYKLSLEDGGSPEDDAVVSTMAVASRLGVSGASATNMLKRLDSMGLVSYTRYQGVELTDAGSKVALEVLRHHRLLETYLAEALGVPWERVHDEAEVLEHVLSEDLEERIAVVLGDPTTDPHGHPIPTRELEMPESSVAPTPRRMWELADGEAASVERVSDEANEALRYLGDLGIRPGARIEVVGRGPLSGPLFMKVAGGPGGDVHALSKELAESVWVA